MTAEIRKTRISLLFDRIPAQRKDPPDSEDPQLSGRGARAESARKQGDTGCREKQRDAGDGVDVTQVTVGAVDFDDAREEGADGQNGDAVAPEFLCKGRDHRRAIGAGKQKRRQRAEQ